MPTIVANGIPALTEADGGPVPGGNLGLRRRAERVLPPALTAPITAGEPTTGRYRRSSAVDARGERERHDAVEPAPRKWFDTWLKDQRTGMADTFDPLHLFENTAARWVDTAAWPPSRDAESYYFGGGTLTTQKPTGSGNDTLVWAPASTANSLPTPPLP